MHNAFADVAVAALGALGDHGEGSVAVCGELPPAVSNSGWVDVCGAAGIVDVEAGNNRLLRAAPVETNRGRHVVAIGSMTVDGLSGSGVSYAERLDEQDVVGEGVVRSVVDNNIASGSVKSTLRQRIVITCGGHDDSTNGT